MAEVARTRWSLVFFATAIIATFAVTSLGCAGYASTAKEAEPSKLASEGDWIIVPRFPLVLQRGSKDCGAAALSAVLAYFGKQSSPESIEASSGRIGERLSAGELEAYARRAGLSSFVFFGTMKDVVYELGHGRPVLVGLGKPIAEKKAVAHYEVVVGYEPKKRLVLLLDPGRGWQVDTLDGFAREWAVSRGVTLVAFLPQRDPPA